MFPNVTNMDFVRYVTELINTFKTTGFIYICAHFLIRSCNGYDIPCLVMLIDLSKESVVCCKLLSELSTSVIH